MQVVGREGSQLVARVWIPLATAFAAVLVELVPLVGTSPSAGADLVVLSLAVFALAGAAGAARCARSLALRTGVVSPIGSGTLPVLRGRVTDPHHHPLAPRAPGLA
jgi:hypothetical protein